MLYKTLSFFFIFVICTSAFAEENTSLSRIYSAEANGIITLKNGYSPAIQPQGTIAYSWIIPIVEPFSIYASGSFGHTLIGRTQEGILYRNYSSLSTYIGGTIRIPWNLPIMTHRPVRIFSGCGFSFANYYGTYQYFVYPSFELGGRVDILTFVSDNNKVNGTLSISLPFRVYFRKALYPSFAGGISLDFTVNR